MRCGNVAAEKVVFCSLSKFVSIRAPDSNLSEITLAHLFSEAVDSLLFITLLVFCHLRVLLSDWLVLLAHRLLLHPSIHSDHL